MADLLNAVFIMDEDQYKYYDILASKVESVAIIDEMGKYPLGRDDCGYYAVQVSVLSNFQQREQLIRFLSTAFKFICLRIEGTTNVFVSSEEDLYDLYEDFYQGKGGGKSLQKDLLTTAERYHLIFKSNSYWDSSYALCLIYKDDEADDITLIDLEDTTPELFCQEDELLITDEITGEAHTIDITLGIQNNFLTFMVLKKLDKSDKKIL